MRCAIQLTAVGSALALAACGRSDRVTSATAAAPAPPAAAAAAAATAVVADAATPRVIPGPTDGVEVPSGMRLVAAYGDDAWQFGGHARSGPAVNGSVAVWGPHWIHVVDQDSGQPVAGVRAPKFWISAATIDATGTQIAALAPDGSVVYWASPNSIPTVLVPVAVAVPGVADPEAQFSKLSASYRQDRGAIERAKTRLAFSPDGARLLAGMHLWELATGRDLVPLRADEIVIDATFDDVTVARLAVHRHERAPHGHDRGGVWHTLVVESLERRTPDRAPEVLTPSLDALPGRPVDELFAVHYARGIGSIDIANDGRIAYVQRGSGWLLGPDGRAPMRGDPTRESTSSFRSVALGQGVIYAVVTEQLPGRVEGALYTLDEKGSARRHVAGHVASITRDGRAVVDRDGRWEVWDLKSTPRGRHLHFRPRSLRSVDQGRATGRGRVVLRDTADEASIFEVRSPGKAPRRLRVEGRYSSQWSLSDDGTILAAVTGGHGQADLRVLSLDDGRVLVDEHFDTDVGVVAASAHVVAAADGRGRVRVYRDGRSSDIDLAGRYDLASALAISPDEKLLAIGTGRGRIFVVALD